MKKIIIVMGLLCVLLSSCQDVYERAYSAELEYKVKKSDEAKSRFMRIWYNMSDDERIEYRNYRSYMNNEAAESLKKMRELESEALSILN